MLLISKNMTYLKKVLDGINKRKGRIFIERIQINEYTIRTEIHQGRKHIVVPVVMMVEGVHNGSVGPLLHLAEDLGRFPETWNGRPVTIPHPVDEEGNFISANSPEIIDQEEVGKVYNTYINDGKLKAEAWLDEEKLRQLSPVALQHIMQHRPLQVSIGVFTDEETVPGTWNGERYEAIARNHRPDHLALLPGGEGACSWNDGCGIRANINDNKEGGKMDKKELIKMTKSLSKEGYSVMSLVNDNEQGHRELISAIQTKLDAIDNDVRIHYLKEVYDDYLVYEVTRREGGSALYKRGYQVNMDESVEFTGEPVEVRRKVEYVTMEAGGFKRTNFNNNKLKKGVMIMEKQGKETPCERVTELINHELTKFTEDNREWLTTLDEKVLERLFPNEPKVAKVETPRINAEQVKQAVKELFSKQEEYIDLMPANMQESTLAGLKLQKAQREKMIKGILDNTEKGVWTDDDLKVMSGDTLEKVFASIPTGVVDYSLMDVPLNTNEQAPLYLGGVEVEETKK